LQSSVKRPAEVKINIFTASPLSARPVTFSCDEYIEAYYDLFLKNWFCLLLAMF